MKIQLKRSNVLSSGAAKTPTASQLEYGELAVNYNNSDPAIFLKDSNNNIIRISGVGNISDDGLTNVPDGTTPPSNPEVGNLWYNSDQGRLYIYFQDTDTSQWVDASPDSWDPSSYPDVTNTSAQSGTLDDRYAMVNGGNSFTGNVGIGTTSPSTLLHLETGHAKQTLKSTNTNTASSIIFDTTNVTTADFLLGQLAGKWNGTDVAYINFEAGSDTTNKDDGIISFLTSAASGSPTEAMRIDSSGNVGIANTDPGTLLQVANSSDNGVIRIGGNNAGTTGLDINYSNSGNTSTTIKQNYRATNGNALLNIDTGTFTISTGTSGTEKLKVDANGRLLIGTSDTIAVNGANCAVQVEGTNSETSRISIINRGNNAGGGGIQIAKSRGTTPALVQDNDQVGGIFFCAGDGNDFVSQAARIECYIDGAPSGSDTPGRITFSTTPDQTDSPVERMLITSGGSSKFMAKAGVDTIYSSTSSAAGTSVAIFRGSHSGTAGSPGTGTDCFFLFSNGNVANTNNSYGAISDVKLKENIVDAKSQWSDIKALQVRNFNFIEGQTHTQLGLVAQEVETVSPGLVSELPDRDEDNNDLGTVTKSVNYSVLYMKAVKALQEAMERIEQLEIKVAALEAG